MTSKATLTVYIDWDPDKTGAGMEFPAPNAVEIDIVVNDGDEPVKIEITDREFSINSRHEPRFVTKEET